MPPPKKIRKRGMVPPPPPLPEPKKFTKPVASGKNPLLKKKLDPALLRQHISSFLRPRQISAFTETSRRHHADFREPLQIRKADLNKAFDDYIQELIETGAKEFKAEGNNNNNNIYHPEVWRAMYEKLKELLKTISKSGNSQHFQFRMRNGHSPFYNILNAYKTLRDMDPEQFDRHHGYEGPNDLLYLFKGLYEYDLNYDPDVFRLYLDIGCDINELLDYDFLPKEEDLIAFIQKHESQPYIDIEKLLKVIETNHKKGKYHFNFGHLYHSKQGKKTIAEILFESMILPYFMNTTTMNIAEFNSTYSSFSRIIKLLAKLTLSSIQ